MELLWLYYVCRCILRHENNYICFGGARSLRSLAHINYMYMIFFPVHLGGLPPPPPPIPKSWLRYWVTCLFFRHSKWLTRAPRRYSEVWYHSNHDDLFRLLPALSTHGVVVAPWSNRQNMIYCSRCSHIFMVVRLKLMEWKILSLFTAQSVFLLLNFLDFQYSTCTKSPVSNFKYLKSIWKSWIRPCFFFLRL